MKSVCLLSAALCPALPAHAVSTVQFTPAVLNTALLFNHDPSVGPVKHSLQWIRDSTGKLQTMTEVWYDRQGCFTKVNMVDKLNGNEFHLENSAGTLRSHSGQRIAGKVNQACQITELENESGRYTLAYNARGLLETMTNRETGNVAQRFEYRHGQFPVRIRDYQNHTDNVFAYPAGNPQFLDMQMVLHNPESTVWLKQSCTYQPDGNANLCAMTTALDEHYQDAPVMMFSNHRVEYY